MSGAALDLVVSITVAGYGRREADCDFTLSLRPAVGKPSTSVLLILGLPSTVSDRELEIYLEPFLADIEGICVLKETKQCSGDCWQLKRAALVFFADPSCTASFTDIYNNMQLPSY
ncbi:hypothetical protein B484DRAFT_439971, partial [Ochromonadaceae sp. CCMP2298]